MGQRIELQALLTEILGSDHVYFQPPPTIQMSYPCVVYRRDDIRIEYGDNKPYKHRIRYQITVIDRDPDSEIPARIAELESCGFDRFYTANGLNHNVFKLFF